MWRRVIQHGRFSVRKFSSGGVASTIAVESGLLKRLSALSPPTQPANLRALEGKLRQFHARTPPVHVLQSLFEEATSSATGAERRRLQDAVIGAAVRAEVASSLGACTSFLQCLGSAKRGDAVLRLVSAWRQRGLTLDATLYAVVIDALGSSSDSSVRDHVDGLIAEFEASDIEPNAPLLNVVLYHHARCGNRERVDATMRRLDVSGLGPDVVTYNSLLGACVGRPAELLSHYDAMLAAGIAPDTVTMTTLMKSLVKHRQYHDVFRVFRSMAAIGATPNDISYAYLLMAAFGLRRSRRVTFILAEMDAANIPRSPVVQNALLRGHVISGDTDAFLRVAEDVLAAPRVATNTANIIADYVPRLAPQLRRPALRRIMAACDRGAIVPDSHTVSTLASASLKLGLAEEAFMLRSRFPSVAPGVVYYNILLGFLRRNDDAAAAVAAVKGLYDVMRRDRVWPDLVTVATVLPAARKANDWRFLSRVAADAVAGGAPTDPGSLSKVDSHTARSLLSLHASQRPALSADSNQSIFE